uniref:U6 snRNA-associated Sm-like protein LSm8 n=1 Tax=Panagrellus redivivus TaxID=6233 RepID=A0A7E4W7S1_PANRE
MSGNLTLDSYIGKVVQVMTCDGRQVFGTLEGYDHSTNVVLQDASERVFSTDGVTNVPLGIYMIRGDNVACVGEVDTELDNRIDFENVTVPPLGAIWEMN